MLTLQDGTIEVKCGEREFAVDLVSLKLAGEEVEGRHQLPENKYRPTPEFLRDLAEAYQSVGVESCTPTMAQQLWKHAWELWAGLKKNSPSSTGSPTGMGSTPSE